MAVNWVEMVDALLLTATPAEAYVCPAGTEATIQAVSINNPTAGVVEVNLYRVPDAGSADDSTLLVKKNVPAGATLQLYEVVNHKLIAGSAIYAAGDGCYLNASGAQSVVN